MIINKIAKALKPFPFIYRSARRIYSLFTGSEYHPAFYDNNYFTKKLKKINSKNIGSVDPHHGLVIGDYHDNHYLLTFRANNYLETQVYLHGTWETHLLEFAAMFLDENEVFLDVGANIGATSIPLAKANPSCEFHLFEPHPAIYENLETNVSLNRLPNLLLSNQAVSDNTSETITFYAQKESNNMGLSSTRLNPDIEQYDIINVKCVSLDQRFLNYTKRIAVIKIDTQGNEWPVLKSARKLISKYRPLVLFEFESEYYEDNDDESARAEIVQFFEQMGYDLFNINKNLDFMPKVTLRGYFKGDIVGVPRNI